MDWLAMSPDVNLVEHAFAQMSLWVRDLDRRPPSNLDELPQGIHKVSVPAAREGPVHYY